MLPNTPVEGNQQQPTGGSESPTSTPSGSQQGQPLPDYVRALVEKQEQLEQQVKSFQKGNDKRIGQFGNDIKRILELKEQGLNETQIQRELFVDNLMQGQNTPPTQPAGSGSGGQALDIEGTLKELQFEPNDVALASLKVLYGGDPNTLLKEAAKLRLTQLTQKPAGPAGALPPSGGSSPENGKMTIEETYTKYAQLEDLMRNYSANKPQIEALQKELDARGATI